jgi:uncharacterized protein YndB with AHSA1/START domain
MSLPPVRRSISVSWDPAAAFRRFTAGFGSWWPRSTLSIGGERIRTIVFETRLGGQIYEEHLDGRRFAWGQITEWDPPRRIRFTWHPSGDAAQAQNVEVEFIPEGTGTLVKLTSTGWEKLGSQAGGARRAYDTGWNYVLQTWAQRRTFGMALLEGLVGMMHLVQKFRGGRDAVIAKARGEIAPAEEVR